MIFIAMLKFTLKKENLYYKLRQKEQDFVMNEKDLKVKNFYEIEKLINK